MKARLSRTRQTLILGAICLPLTQVTCTNDSFAQLYHDTVFLTATQFLYGTTNIIFANLLGL